MDKIDEHIVRILQENAKISMKNLAEAVHLTSPSVIERVRKIEEQKIIEGYHAHISLKKINRPISAIVLFESKDCKGLAKFCHNHPDVLECYRVAREISYIVKLATHSVETLEQFIDNSMQYGSPSTNIVLSSYENKVIAPYTIEDKTLF